MANLNLKLSGLLLLALIGCPVLVDAGTITLGWEVFDEYANFKEFRVYRGNPSNCHLLAPLPALLNAQGTPVIIPRSVAPAVTPRLYIDTQVPDTTQTVCYEMTSVNTLGQESMRSKRKMLLYLNTIPIPELTLVE